MGLGHSPSIVVDGLIFHIDPNNPRCYSGSGNTIYNLVNPSIGGTFVGFTSNPIDNTETRSLVYNGSTTYQEFYPIEPNRLTVSVWFKATGAPSHNDVYGGTILASGPQYFMSYAMLYRWTTNTVLFFQTSPSEIISASAPANKIVNAVYTYDGVNAKLYIDGVLASTVAYTTDPSYFGSGNRNLVLGRWGYPGYERYFNGNIYQASLYNRALSASEISQNFNATKNRFVNALPPVRNGLVLELDAANTASYSGAGNTWYDLSGNNLNGTLTNGPTYLGIGSTSSLVFDRTNDHILIADNSLLNTFTGMTLEVIVKYTTTNNQIFAQKWNYALGNDGYTLEIWQSAIIGACYTSGVTYISSSISNYPINNIYHIIFTLNGTTQTMYINGTSVATNNNGSLPSISGTNFTIGQRSNLGGEYFGGNNYLTKFYNRGLSAYEVKQNFDYYRTRYNI